MDAGGASPSATRDCRRPSGPMAACESCHVAQSPSLRKRVGGRDGCGHNIERGQPWHASVCQDRRRFRRGRRQTISAIWQYTFPCVRCDNAPRDCSRQSAVDSPSWSCAERNLKGGRAAVQGRGELNERQAAGRPGPGARERGTAARRPQPRPAGPSTRLRAARARAAARRGSWTPLTSPDLASPDLT